MSENSDWLEEKRTVAVITADEKMQVDEKEEICMKDFQSFMSEKEETMWRCPEHKVLFDLAEVCSDCGFGIADFESNGWEVFNFFEAVTFDEAQFIRGA